MLSSPTPGQEGRAGPTATSGLTPTAPSTGVCAIVPSAPIRARWKLPVTERRSSQVTQASPAGSRARRTLAWGKKASVTRVVGAAKV